MSRTWNITYLVRCIYHQVKPVSAMLGCLYLRISFHFINLFINFPFVNTYLEFYYISSDAVFRVKLIFKTIVRK